MNTKLQKALEETARQHGYVLEVGCLYCGHKKETLGSVLNHPTTFFSVRKISTPANKENKNRVRYESTNAYTNLLQKHSLDEHGVWRVLGECDNAGLAGSHTQPDLGTYEGKLDDVINTAVNLPNFWAWGAGGDIQKVTVQKPIKV